MSLFNLFSLQILINYCLKENILVTFISPRLIYGLIWKIFYNKYVSFSLRAQFRRCVPFISHNFSLRYKPNNRFCQKYVLYVFNSVLNSNPTSHELPRRYLHKTFNLIEHSTCIRIESLNDVGHLKIALIRINYTIPFKCKFKEEVNRRLKLKYIKNKCLAFYITVKEIF